MPAGREDAFHGLARPENRVPMKSNGARVSVVVARPYMEGLFSQKLTFETPLVGVRKM